MSTPLKTDRACEQALAFRIAQQAEMRRNVIFDRIEADKYRQAWADAGRYVAWKLNVGPRPPWIPEGTDPEIG